MRTDQMTPTPLRWRHLGFAGIYVLAIACLTLLTGCGPDFHHKCDGTTGIYYKHRALDAVPNDPRCVNP